MLLLFYGDDVKKRNLGLERFSTSFGKDMEILSIGSSNFAREEIESFASSSGLFSGQSAVFFDNILEKEEIREFLFAKLDNFAQSKNHFVFSEGKLDKATVDTFKKSRAEINSFELPKEKKEKYNNFLLANAFGDKNKVSLWVSYRQAVNLGVGLEELVGVLFWKAKDMVLKKNFSKFSQKELESFASRVAYLLPKARRDGLDAELAMEEFLLEAF